MRRRVEGIDAALDRMARDVGGGLPLLLSVFAEEAIVDIRRVWPVYSGRSREALRVIGRVDAWTDVRDSSRSGGVAIECDVPYASWIHEKGGPRGPTWILKIVDLCRQNAEAIGARATRRIRRDNIQIGDATERD